MSGRGRLIALEGVDGCGKSTQARLLADALGALATAEPGATQLGATLRRLVLDPGLPPVSDRAEALLVAADRAQHVSEVVLPALEEGRWVVTDRFSASTLAYQGYGRGLDLGELRRLVSWAAAGVAPDLTVVLDVPVAVARERLDLDTAGADRLERLDAGFHERVRAGYLALADADPGTWAVLDAAGDVAAVARQVMAVVVERLAPLPTVTR
ncbi:MAG TPA: dTMP kinase [Acidimicrobiales bacterium]|nr:dTMP kinase [Acidimicrobiales bacterium]HLN43177.1 dTMP kinase [Acidimicrobiales bacterium]